MFTYRYTLTMHCHCSGLTRSRRIELQYTSVVASGRWASVRLWRHCRHLAFYTYRIKKLSSLLALW